MTGRRRGRKRAQMTPPWGRIPLQEQGTSPDRVPLVRPPGPPSPRTSSPTSLSRWSFICTLHSLKHASPASS
jgi:hypothetical protein